MRKKIVFLPYDMDTAIATNNEGSLVFSYNLEDIDHTASGADIFNGQQSVLWKNLREMFPNELKSMYQTLRSQGKLSYPVVERMFEEHQAKWPEAVFNEDSWYKYLAPLEESGNASYLSMLQGSKAAQRKWWLYNRFRYIDSKYNAGDALTDVITVRGYAKANISVTPYADVYATVKYGSYLVQSRATRGVATTLICPLDNVNDTEIMIFSASQLASVGDLSGLMVGYADFSMATKLQDLVLGRSNEGITPGSENYYSNGNLQTLYLGNNTLLQSIDIRNCTGLGTGDQTSVDISGCKNVRTVLFDGTNIAGLTLPDGGVIETLHLPGTITILKVLNQTIISDFTCPDMTHITTLWLDNVSQVIDARSIIYGMAAGSRVRLFNFSWTASEAHGVTDFVNVLDTMRGLDQNGNNTATAQVYGAIHCSVVSQYVLDYVSTRYSDLRITYDILGLTVIYSNYDGSFLDYEVIESSGDDAVSAPTPVRPSTVYFDYTFSGWSSTEGGDAEANILDNITANKQVYAAYTSSTHYFTIRFFVGTVLKDTQYVAYGGDAVYYDDATGSNTPVYNGDGDPMDYVFTGWSVDVTNITQDIDTYAQFVYRPSYARKYLQDTLTEYTDQNGLTNLPDFAFAGLTQLQSLTMPDLEFEDGYVPYCFFAYTRKLARVVTSYGTIMPGGAAVSISGVTEIRDYAFWYFQDQVHAVDFSDNTLWASLIFPDCTTVGDYSFWRTNYVNLDFPKVTAYGTWAFHATHTKVLKLPKIESCTVSGAFDYSYALETLIMSGLNGRVSPLNYLTNETKLTLKVLDIGGTTRINVAFKNFEKIETVVMRSAEVVGFSTTSIYTLRLFYENGPMANGTGRIYVPNALLSAYQSATGWSTYASCFVAIEGSEWEIAV